MSLTFDFTLNPCIVYLTDLFRIEPSPFLIIESLIEKLNVFQINEVDKGVTYIALIKEINGQIEKIELIFEFSVYSCEHLLLGILVRYIPDHQCGPTLRNDLLNIDFESIVILDS